MTPGPGGGFQPTPSSPTRAPEPRLLEEDAAAERAPVALGRGVVEKPIVTATKDDIW